MRLRFTQWEWLAIPLLSLLILSGCGNKDQKQCDELVIFLRTEILNQNRINLPILTKSQTKQFGHYVKQYQLLINTERELQHQLGVISHNIHALAPLQTTQQMVATRDNIAYTLEQLQHDQHQLSLLLIQYQQQHDAFMQSEALQEAFDRTFDAIILPSLELAQGTLTPLISLLNNALALIDFVQTHADLQALQQNQLIFHNKNDLAHYQQLNLALQQAQAAYLAH